MATYFGVVIADQTITVGAGGAISGSIVDTNGTNGASGAVIVFYWW